MGRERGGGAFTPFTQYAFLSIIFVSVRGLLLMCTLTLVVSLHQRRLLTVVWQFDVFTLSLALAEDARWRLERGEADIAFAVSVTFHESTYNNDESCVYIDSNLVDIEMVFFNS